MDKTERYIRAATRDNTRQAYRAALRHFEEQWGGFLPATADSVARYLADHAETLSLNTLKQRLAGIAQWHLDQGFPDPTKAPHVRKVLKGIRELHPAQEKQAKPLQLEHLGQLVRWIEAELAVYPSDSAQALRLTRDRALILLGFWRGFRSDELCRLRVEHVTIEPGRGISVYLPRSKGDRQAQGRTVKTPALQTLCPVAACHDWLSLAQIKEGPLFRQINRWGKLCEGALNSRSIIPLLRRCFEAAGIATPDRYSGHSLRRGFATWAHASGWDLKALMEYVGWRDMKAAMRYIESPADFRVLGHERSADPQGPPQALYNDVHPSEDLRLIATLDLHLSITRYHASASSVTKARERIERICLKTYAMRCISRQQGHYRLKIHHESPEHLSRLVNELLSEMQQIADTHDCFTEAYLVDPATGQRWD